MRQPIAALTLLLASAACAQDVVSFFFPGGTLCPFSLPPSYPSPTNKKTPQHVPPHKTNTQPQIGYDGIEPVATINVANPSTTEFHIACPTGAKPDDCGWGPGLDVTILSQTRFQAEMSTEGVSMSLGCDYNKKVIQMTCTVAQQGGNDDTQGKPITATLSKADVKFLTATVVVGQSLLDGSASGSATSTKASAAPQSTASPAIAAATTTSASASAKSTGLMTLSGSASSTGAASASSASATKSGSASASAPESTGAATKYGIESSALLALVGAAALHLW